MKASAGQPRRRSPLFWTGYALSCGLMVGLTAGTWSAVRLPEWLDATPNAPVDDEFGFGPRRPGVQRPAPVPQRANQRRPDRRRAAPSPNPQP